MPSSGLRHATVVISDRVEHNSQPNGWLPHDSEPNAPGDAEEVDVVGGYLERLPLAAVHAGLADFAEIWHYSAQPNGSYRQDSAHLARRVFPLPDTTAPFHCDAMVEFIREHGAPKILCVWGLGVSEALLEACADSTIIYNSIDAPTLRVPPQVSQHFDLILTGAQWQSDEVQIPHPGKATAILPIGPEFASPETFYPTDDAKIYDVIYVAAAQAYKRHDVLFAALARSPRPLKALCVFGYGEDAPRLRQQATELGLDIDFVGPPGVDYPEVNRLMNMARVGVVCGVEDGAPAILTEYMLAGLPVVANADLACGLQYILPNTGIIASAAQFERAILEAIDHPTRFNPRSAVLERWAWPHSIERLKQALGDLNISSQINPAHLPGASFEPAASN